MASRWIVLVMLCVEACGGDDGAVVPDARTVPDAQIGDDAPSADAEPAPDAVPGTPAHTLYLNFDGGTFHAGFESSVNNASSLITGTKNISPWADTANIAGIVAEISAILAPYSISVVTTRPAPTVLYTMVVFGAAPTQAGFSASTSAVMPFSCSTIQRAIAFVFNPVTSVHGVAQEVVAMEGSLFTVPKSTTSGDCMCFNSCDPSALVATCTIGGAGTPMEPANACETVAPFDEAARFLAAFGPHP